MFKFSNSCKNSNKLCLQHWTSIQELLKHFWSSYPITTPYLGTKVNAYELLFCAFLASLQDREDWLSSN